MMMDRKSLSVQASDLIVATEVASSSGKAFQSQGTLTAKAMPSYWFCFWNSQEALA